jgi:hypothetical protein
MFDLGCTSDKIWNLQELLVYLSSNQHKQIGIRISPEAICLESLGLYQILDNFNFKQVDIQTYNPFETSIKYNIVFQDNFWFAGQQSIGTELHAWNQKKIFFCFYHRPTAGRLGIASKMLAHYQEDTHIHFSAQVESNDLAQFEFDKLLSYDIASIVNAGKLVNQLPMLLGSPNKYTYCNGYYYDDPLTNLYKDILIDLVVESHVAGKTFFPTEKTIRPMWLKKPFIVFASKDYLCYLRQMGFMTFNNCWDEEYDGYEGKERYVRIFKLIDSIAKKTKSELNDMYWSLKYVLEHNYNLLHTQTYQKKVNKID